MKQDRKLPELELMRRARDIRRRYAPLAARARQLCIALFGEEAGVGGEDPIRTALSWLYNEEHKP